MQSGFGNERSPRRRVIYAAARTGHKANGVKKRQTNES